MRQGGDVEEEGRGENEGNDDADGGADQAKNGLDPGNVDANDQGYDHDTWTTIEGLPFELVNGLDLSTFEAAFVRPMSRLDSSHGMGNDQRRLTRKRFVNVSGVFSRRNYYTCHLVGPTRRSVNLLAY